MELNTSQYELMKVSELITECKEKGIKGYGQNGMTKQNIIKLLKGEIKYKDRRHKENWSDKKREIFETTLKKKQLKNNLFDYLTENNPLIIKKFVGDTDELKEISYGTMVKYKWKCEKYSECSNTFEARPRDLFRNDKTQKKYCSICMLKQRGETFQKNMLKKNGSILEKMPDIINVWCEDNLYKSDELTDYSHKKVKLKCPNKSAKHPNYEICVYNIQESNCYSCPKCSIQTSKAEMRIYSELKCCFNDVKWQQKIDGREADITIEDLKLVIEIDGFPWHMNKTKNDLEKNIIFENNGYRVVRVRDIKLGEIACDTIICNISDLTLVDYNKILEWIKLKFKYDINSIDEFKNTVYYNNIQASVLSIPYKESVEYQFPESKELWDYEKNNPFIPSQIRRGSHILVSLKCQNGHSYERPIKQLFRFVKGRKHIMYCPECTTQKSAKI